MSLLLSPALSGSCWEPQLYECSPSPVCHVPLLHPSTPLLLPDSTHSVSLTGLERPIIILLLLCLTFADCCVWNEICAFQILFSLATFWHSMSCAPSDIAVKTLFERRPHLFSNESSLKGRSASKSNTWWWMWLCLKRRLVQTQEFLFISLQHTVYEPECDYLMYQPLITFLLIISLLRQE